MRFNEKWSLRHITDSAQRILEQIPSRAGDRGLHVVDDTSILLLALWSLLLWERKVGRIAIEHLGVDTFALAIEVNRLLDTKLDEHPVAFDTQQNRLVMTKTGEPYQRWDFDVLLEPILQGAEHEALALGHNYVGSEHLVLAIRRLAKGDLAAVLLRYGIEHEPYKAVVVDLLS